MLYTTKLFEIQNTMDQGLNFFVCFRFIIYKTQVEAIIDDYWPVMSVTLLSVLIMLLSNSWRFLYGYEDANSTHTMFIPL